jgi:hypothetical protein
VTTVQNDEYAIMKQCNKRDDYLQDGNERTPMQMNKLAKSLHRALIAAGRFDACKI